MVFFLAFCTISTLLYGLALWITHHQLRWRYIGLIQIALTAAYLISIFFMAHQMQDYWR